MEGAIIMPNFRITDTLSHDDDTDYVALAARVGNQPPIMSPIKTMGDVDNGTHQVNLSIDLDIPQGQGITFSYMVVNSGNHDPKPALDKLIEMAGKVDSANGDVNTKKDESGKG
jgi:hypothetical protein